MHLQSAEQIVCKVFGKTTSSHVQLHRHIIPACRYLKVHGIRGKSKVHCLRNLASALVEQEVVKIENDVKVLTGDDIELSGDRNLLDEIRAWEESNKQNKENKPIN